MNDLVALFLLLTLIVTILLGAWCVADRHRRLSSLEAQLVRLRADIEDLSVERDSLEKEAALLQNDPLTLERAIRERLGYIRKGEVLVKVSVEPPA